MTEAALLAAVLANPEDDACRLIYADWLDEQGRCEQAEFIRLQCELARLKPPHTQFLDNPTAYPDCGCYYCALRRRERELLDAQKVYPLLTGVKFINATWRFSRGFISSVRCRAEEWLAEGDAILAAQPVREVVLTTDLAGLPESFRATLRIDPETGRGYYSDLYKGVAFTLKPPEPERYGRVVQIPADVGSPESLARDMAAMERAGRDAAMRENMRFMEAMGIPVDPPAAAARARGAAASAARARPRPHDGGGPRPGSIPRNAGRQARRPRLKFAAPVPRPCPRPRGPINHAVNPRHRQGDGRVAAATLPDGVAALGLHHLAPEPAAVAPLSPLAHRIAPCAFRGSRPRRAGRQGCRRHCRAFGCKQGRASRERTR